jgi:hypothetical protein
MADKYLKKFRRCILEYTNIADAYNISEEDNDEMAQNDITPNQNIPQDTNQDEMGFGMQNNEMGAPVDNSSIGDANNGVEGFNPEGTDETMPMDGMGSTDDNIDTMQPEDEVIDVEELTQSQEDTEEKVEDINITMEKGFEKILGVVSKLNQMIDSNSASMEEIKREMEKRNPTPLEKLHMRAANDSYPFNVSPESYWADKEASSNYRIGGEDEPDAEQYTITQGDIDRMTDFNQISKDLNDATFNQNLLNIFGLR